MAKLCMINRQIKRERISQKYAQQRSHLKGVSKDMSLTERERHEARVALNRLPRDANPIRLRNRCHITGRANGYYRRFGLARNKLREVAMRGDVPGLIKASW